MNNGRKEVIANNQVSRMVTYKDVKAMVINGYLKNESLHSEMIKIDLSKELFNIKIPYIIMQGSTDIVTPTNIIFEFIKESENKNLIFYRIENSGHLPSKKGMDEILSKVISLISK